MSPVTSIGRMMPVDILPPKAAAISGMTIITTPPMPVLEKPINRAVTTIRPSDQGSRPSICAGCVSSIMLASILGVFPPQELSMTFQLVALDLDGTALDSHLQIRPATIEALQRARAQGVEVMLVTGRHHVATYAYWHQLGLELPAICCNGTYVYDFRTHRP